MSEQRLGRLDRAVERLMQAQREALETCERALGYDDSVYDGAHEFLETPRQPLEEGQHYGAALEDVRAILVAASEDVADILEGGSGSSG
jgi:hypothetical protein